MAPLPRVKVWPACLLVLSLFVLDGGVGAVQAPSGSSSTSWNTLSGAYPLIIARGGSSGLFPEQTMPAYYDALNNSLPAIALFCDVQLTKDGHGICRTNLDLSNSTDINIVFPNQNNTYIVNGISVGGWFSIDFTSDSLLNNVTATQPVQTRTNVFDGEFSLFTPDMLATLIAQNMNATHSQSFTWLNIQYSRFYEQHNISMTNYALSVIRNMKPGYISSTEVGLLRALQTEAQKGGTKLILQFLQPDALDPSINRTYGSLLQNLTDIKTFVSGILVPKNYILPVDNVTLYLMPATSLVQHAHALKLEVYALGFGNDLYPFSFNYSFDPIREYRSYIDDPATAVDGLLSDFPTTASEAIACYNMDLLTAPASVANTVQSSSLTTVISHNGASGDFPGCTALSYAGAIADGADYIDCPVQITKDGIPICLDSPDLFVSTNVASTPFSYLQRVIPEIQVSPGVFTFDLTWSQISTLKAVQYSPEGKTYQIFRDPAYDNTQGVLRLSDFLDLAKNNSKVGIYIVIQNAYFLDASEKINVVTPVILALKQAGFTTSSNILLESEDIAVLRELKKFLPYKLVYEVVLPAGESLVTLTDSALAQIKEVADGVAVPRPLIEPVNNTLFFLNPSPMTVQRFHSFNLTVFVEYLRNEFIVLAFDYEADPTLELHTLIDLYGVDGVRTDFPKTAKAYLNNLCLQPSITAAHVSYSIHSIFPGSLLEKIPGYTPLPEGAPAPALLVAEPPLPSNTPASAPKPSSAVHILPGFFSSMMVSLACLLYTLRG